MAELSQKILALSGGVGGAKLALGLSKQLTADQLSIVVNTADDFEHMGLSISPDIDTLMYTLAEINDQKQGWGLANESWNMLEALQQLGGESWFRLGDRDLATHLERSQRLAKGQPLSAVTRYLCQQLDVSHTVIPMSDDKVRTKMKMAAGGELSFQEYFVREQCQPAIEGYYFDGIEHAQPQRQLMELLSSDQLSAIIICPSNPFVSVEPILKLKGVRQAMIDNPAPVIAVSPIVAGLAIKGPTAKMMKELSMPVSATAVVEYYGELIDGFVLDQSDRPLQAAIAALGVEVCCVNTVMKSLQDRIKLASEVLSFAVKVAAEAAV